jgi:large repetitive protein
MIRDRGIPASILVLPFLTGPAWAQVCSAPSGVVPLGGGSVGAAGAIRLEVEGAPVVRAPFALRVESGAPGALGLLWLGGVASPIPLPGFGAVLHVDSPLLSVVFVLDGEGRSPKLIPVPFVPAGLCGVKAHVQAAVLDPVGAGGVAFTPGVGLAIGTPKLGAAVLYPVPRYDFGGGVEPTDLALGDANQDGQPDLFVLARDLNTVGVLAGTATGRFLPLSTVAVSPASAALEVADLDLDGFDDIVVAGSNITFRRGVGAGAFAAPVIVAAGFATFDLTLGDATGDGRPDIVHLDAVGQTVRVVAGLPGGGFASPVSIPAINASAVRVADLDQDGLPDLVVSTSAAPVVAFGLGGGAFAAPVQLPGPGGLLTRLMVGDSDQDGILDLHACRVTVAPGTVRYRGLGGGAFAAPETFATPGIWQGLELADLNLDGRSDLVGAGSAGVFVALGRGGGGFVASSLGAGTGFASGIVTADFDRNGTTDVASSLGNGVVTLFAPGDGTLHSTRRIGIGPPSGPSMTTARVESCDLNGDGLLDVLVASSVVTPPPTSISLVTAAVGDGSGNFTTTAHFDAGLFVTEIAPGDFNGDGKVDVLVGRNSVPTQFQVHFGQGNGTFLPGPTTSFPGGGVTSTFAVGLVDADGVLDVVQVIGAVAHVMFGVGNGQFTPGPTISFPTSAASVRIADLDADGRADIVVGGSFTLAVSMQLPSGFATPASTSVPSTVFELADFDGDGRLDLVAGAAGALRVLLGLGNGSFASPVTYGSLAQAPSDIAVEDVDGDGGLDVVAMAGAPGGRFAVFLGNGDGTLDPAFRLFHGGTGRAAIGDFDANGTPDVVTTGTGSESGGTGVLILHVRH